MPQLAPRVPRAAPVVPGEFYRYQMTFKLVKSAAGAHSRKRLSHTHQNPLETAEARVPLFGAQEVAAILKIKPWKLQKLLESPTLKLPEPRKLGTAIRSTRVFTDADVLRIALAVELAADGLSAKGIGSTVLPEFEDNEQILGLGVRGGEMQSVQYGVGIMRSGARRTAEVFAWDRRENFVTKNKPYYVRNVTELIEKYSERIKAAKK